MQLQLCYIWVQKYRNFRDAGFNFSSEQKFEYDAFTKELEVKSVEKLPRNFFGTSITEVTGLIGKNGSGKSNILELVCKLLKGGKSALNTPFFIITKEDDQFICYVSSVSVISTFAGRNIQFRKYDQKVDPLKIVYFSNVFDERIHSFDKEVSDISNNYRYRRPPFRMVSGITDFEKQVLFIESAFFQKLGMPVPTKIRISSPRWNNSNLRIESRQNLFGDFFEELNQFTRDFLKRVNEIKDSNRFYFLTVYSYFIETLKLLNDRDFTEKSEGAREQLLSEFANEIGISDRNYKRTGYLTKELVSWMKYVVEYILRVDSKGRNKIENFYEKLDLLQQLESYVNEIEINSVTEGIRNKRVDYFVLDYRELLYQKFDFLQLFRNNKMFTVDWLGLSSGHKAYLNIFSLLHHELKRVRKENVLICIDEGDLYLHPQWQIEFFQRLIYILPEIFSGKIQLILTSHSPFLLSDLPKQNITIVDSKGEDSSIDGFRLEKQTFAGNLYNLYAEPFFLGNQRTSVFASNKIEQLIALLSDQKGNFSENQKIDLTKRINLIGDDIIRLNLLKKLKND